MFFQYMKLWFYFFSIKKHKFLAKGIKRAFYMFYPFFKKKYNFRFIFKGKFSGQGNNKKKIWKLKNGYIGFSKKNQKNIIIINRNKTHHGAISSKIIF